MEDEVLREFGRGNWAKVTQFALAPSLWEVFVLYGVWVDASE